MTTKNDNVLQGSSVLEMSSCLHNVYLSDLAMSGQGPPRTAGRSYETPILAVKIAENRARQDREAGSSIAV